MNANLRARFQHIENSTDNSKESLLEDALALITEVQATNDKKLEHDIYIYLGRSYRFQGEAFKSLDTLNKAYNLLNANFPHDSKRLAYLYREYSNTYNNSLEEYNMAIDYCLKGYRLNVPELNPTFLNNLGSISISLKQFEKAEAYLNKGKQQCGEKDVVVRSFIEHNFGLLNKTQRHFDEALKHYDACLEICRENMQKQLPTDELQYIQYIDGYTYLGIAEINFERQEFKIASEALNILQKKATAGKQNRILSQAYILEGKVLLAQEKFTAFKNLYKKSIEFCDKSEFLVDKQEWLTSVQEVYEKEGDLKNALEISKRWISNKEEIVSKLNAINLSALLVSKEKQILNLENRNRLMQLQKEELEQFAYIVTHDLKTPLSNISNFAGLFSKKYADSIDDTGKEYLNFITDSSVNLSEMLSDLLQFITLDIDEDQLPLQDVDQVIRDIISKNRFDDTVKIIFDDLPKLPLRRFHLEILFDNIINNAVKFKRIDVPVEIEIKGREDEENYHYIISDNGIGIKDNYKDIVFGIFKRLKESDAKGTGMGLAICKKIIQTYSGNIKISNNEPHGCQLHFSISKKAVID